MQTQLRQDPLIGQTIAGTYRVIERLGAGGMGSLYQALHLQLDQPVALKFLQQQLRTDIDSIKRLRREAQMLSKLSHPNIVAVKAFHLEENNGTPFLVMEYLEGETLGAFLARRGPLNNSQFKAVFEQVREGLAYAHAKGIIHRDLKPDNIMLVSAGDKVQVKILDFGLAKLEQESEGQRITATGALMGSLHYVSPEQCNGGKIDQRADLYSLACVMWESLTGLKPFDDATGMLIIRRHLEASLPPLPNGIAPALSTILQRCTATDPAARFYTIDQFWRAIEQNIPVKVSGPSLWSRHRKPLMRTALAVLCAVPAICFFWQTLVSQLQHDLSSQHNRVIQELRDEDKVWDKFAEAVRSGSYDKQTELWQTTQTLRTEPSANRLGALAKIILQRLPHAMPNEKQYLTDRYIDCRNEQLRKEQNADVKLKAMRQTIADLERFTTAEKAEQFLEREMTRAHFEENHYYCLGMVMQDVQFLGQKPYLSVDDRLAYEERNDAIWVSVWRMLDNYAIGREIGAPGEKQSHGKPPADMMRMAVAGRDVTLSHLLATKNYSRAAQICEQWLAYTQILHCGEPSDTIRIAEIRKQAVQHLGHEPPPDTDWTESRPKGWESGHPVR